MVPKCLACSAVTATSMTMRLYKAQDTLGRMSLRRLMVSAMNSAAGSAPWVISFPTADGMGRTRGCPLHVAG